MKIALLTQGTRGDVEPFVVLGKELKRRGHVVTVSAPVNFDALIQKAGLQSAPISTDVQELLNTAEGRKLLKANPLAVMSSMKRTIYPLIKESLGEYYRLCQLNDKIFYHTKTLCDCFSGCFPGKMVRAMLVPGVVRTSAFANPALSGFGLLRYVPRQSYFIQDAARIMFRKPISEFLKANGLRATPGDYVDSLPFVYAVSELLLEKPADYPANSYFTGFWREQEANALLPSGLEEFLSRGDAPVLVTFGSMVHKKLDWCLEMICQICRERNERLIIVRGWNKETSLSGEGSVFVVDSAPYAVLMGRVKAVIHHGGVGTVASCMYAGVPMLILPVMYPVGDQLFWGERVLEKGLGVKPLPLMKVNKERLSARITELLDSPDLRTRCREMRESMAAEDGTGRLAELLEQGML